MLKRKHDALSDAGVQTAQPKQKPYKIADGGGLYLRVTPNGRRRWRMDFQTSGIWRTLCLGEYPATSLEDARSMRDEIRQMRAEGLDPAATLRAQKAALTAERNSFEAVARQWHAMNGDSWSPRLGARVMRWLEEEAFPLLGRRPMRDVTAREAFAACCRAEARTVCTARRLLQYMGAIFRYAVSIRRASGDPTKALREAMDLAWQRAWAPFADPQSIGRLLRAMDDCLGDPATRAALRLAPLLLLRQGELRRLEWREVDLDSKEIRLPAEKLEMGRSQVVPLSGQAAAILQEVRRSTGSRKFVFSPAPNDGAPTPGHRFRLALIQSGYTGEEKVFSGFRRLAGAVFRKQGYRPDTIAGLLSRCRLNPGWTSGSYAEHKTLHRQMMQSWADYLDRLRVNA